MPVLATITTAAAATGLAIGGYFYAAMWPTSQIFGRTILVPAHRPPQIQRIRAMTRVPALQTVKNSCWKTGVLFPVPKGRNNL